MRKALLAKATTYDSAFAHSLAFIQRPEHDEDNLSKYRQIANSK